MNSTIEKRSRSNLSGFTLIEVMLAALLANIVMVAIGGLFVGYWRTANDFLQEEQAMQEIAFFSQLFSENARALPSVTDAELDSARIQFGSDRAIKYETNSIHYVNGGNVGVLLENSVVSHMNPEITNGCLINLEVQLWESELSRTNSYDLYVMPRNG
jgi:type II secretory pathway pseudopilin PulG